MKIFTQILLVLFEILIFTSALILISTVFYPIDSFSEITERIIPCYGIYQFATFLILSNINDSRRDMYLAVLKNYRFAELYLNSANPLILDEIEINVSYQLEESTFNDKDIRKEYENLMKTIEFKDIVQIQYKIIFYEHACQLESLGWRFNFILRKRK